MTGAVVVDLVSPNNAEAGRACLVSLSLNRADAGNTLSVVSDAFALSCLIFFALAFATTSESESEI